MLVWYSAAVSAYACFGASASTAKQKLKRPKNRIPLFTINSPVSLDCYNFVHIYYKIIKTCYGKIIFLPRVFVNLLRKSSYSFNNLAAKLYRLRLLINQYKNRIKRIGPAS